MGVREIDHVQLAMPAGMEADAEAFYQGVLGIPRVPKPPHLEARGGCWFEDGSLKVHLGVDADFRPARKAHPAFLVDDLPALVDVLRGAGVSINDGEPLEGYDRVYVDDPFGNRIELLEPIPAAMGQVEAVPGTAFQLHAAVDHAGRRQSNQVEAVPGTVSTW